MKEIHFGEIIAKKRREKGITQDELAANVGVTKASVSKWETGISYPDVALLPLLASYFDISIDELMGYSPQMEQEDIRELYERLAADFAQKPFEEVMSECELIVKKYYSCYHLLMRIAMLYINHVSMVDDPERVKEIMEETSRLCDRIKENCKDMADVRNAVYCQAMSFLAMGDGRAVLDLLGEFPYFNTMASDSSLISQAYQMLGSQEKANEVSLAQIYVNIMNTLSSLNEFIYHYPTDKETAELSFLRAEKIADIFNIRELNPNLVAQLYAFGAKMYQVCGFPEKAIETLSKYADVCINGFFPFKPDVDGYFKKIGGWLDENRSPMPRNEEIVKKSMLNDVILLPVFEPLRGNPEYESLVKRMKDFAEGKTK